MGVNGIKTLRPQIALNPWIYRPGVFCFVTILLYICIMYNCGLKSVSPVPSKQSPAENERFIVIQHKPLLKFAFTGLDQEGEISPCRISSDVPLPTTVNHTEKISLRTDDLQAIGLRHGMRVG
jgi:hypothetical protein